MTEYVVNLMWDNEAAVWIAVNDDIPVAMENASLDALVVEVKSMAIEMLEENNRLPVSGEIKLRFNAECIERLAIYEREMNIDIQEKSEELMTDLQFLAYKESRDKLDVSLRKEIDLLQSRCTALEASNGDSGMTDLQFQCYVKLRDECYALRNENESLSKKCAELEHKLEILKNKQD